jgi:phosphoserine phosphatase
MKLVYLRGLKREDVDGWIKECFGQSLEEILFAGSVNAVRQLAQAGLPQVLLTGAPRPLAERIGDYLRVDDIIAAEPEYSDGVYTGGLIGKHPRGRRKIGFAASWLKVNGYEWSDTIGLGNHYDDRFLLEQAGVGIAVNPDRRLYRLAQARGWEIVTEPNQDFSVLSLADGRPL